MSENSFKKVIETRTEQCQFLNEGYEYTAYDIYVDHCYGGYIHFKDKSVGIDSLEDNFFSSSLSDKPDCDGNCFMCPIGYEVLDRYSSNIKYRKFTVE